MPVTLDACDDQLSLPLAIFSKVVRVEQDSAGTLRSLRVRSNYNSRVFEVSTLQNIRCRTRCAQ